MPKLYRVPNLDEQKLFFKTFGKPVNQFYNAAGFDIVKFDEFLAVPDGQSTKDFIFKKYGQQAVDLIVSLF